MQDEPDEHGPDDTLPFNESPGFLIRDLNRAVQRELALRVQEHGVSHGHWYFLRLLWQEDGLTQRELAQRLGMMEPTAVVALRGMEADGWIRRVRSEVDKRKVHILLTPAGRRLRKQLLPIARAVNERVLKGMSRDEQLFLIGLLRRARQNFAPQDPNAGDDQAQPAPQRREPASTPERPAAMAEKRAAASRRA